MVLKPQDLLVLLKLVTLGALDGATTVWPPTWA